MMAYSRFGPGCCCATGHTDPTHDCLSECLTGYKPLEWEVTFPAGLWTQYQTSCCEDIYPASSDLVLILTMLVSGGSAQICRWRYCITDTCYPSVPGRLAAYDLWVEYQGASGHFVVLTFYNDLQVDFIDCDGIYIPVQRDPFNRGIVTTWRAPVPASFVETFKVRCTEIEMDLEWLTGSGAFKCGAVPGAPVDKTKKPHVRAIA